MSPVLTVSLFYPVLLNYETQSRVNAADEKRKAGSQSLFYNCLLYSVLPVLTQHGLVFAAVTAVDANAQQDNKKW